MLRFFILAIFLSVSLTVTPSISSLGTTLPPLWNYLNYRVFNDLMKQSLPLVPYRLSYGSIGRYWGYNLTFIGGLEHQYPAGL